MAKTVGAGTQSIPLGRKPKTKAEAWRALSPEAKSILRQKRQEGMFGGTPGKAPYWMSQEQGNPAAMIEAQHYIERALTGWRAEIPNLVREFLRG